MVLGILASAALMTCTKDAHVFELFESTYVFAATAYLATNFGMEWSLLAIGSGMIIGLRINVSMTIGAVLAWILAPVMLQKFGILQAGYKRNDVLFWVMWPATGMMVASGLAALALRWRVLGRTFKNLTAGNSNADEFPMRWAMWGAGLAAIALIAVQRFMLNQPIWVTAVAILLSAPLALVALRVLGETNWGPVSALSNMMQGIFALIAPGNIPANMIASGTTGTVAIESESIMQDYRAGEVVGSSPRYLTYMQLLATPVGAAAVSWMYPVLRDQYGIGEGGLSSPISRKWAGFAEILSRGIEALPPKSLPALAVGVVVGIFLAYLESRAKDKTWIPSPTGMGIGMLVPASVIVTMLLGSIIGKVWERVSPNSSRLCQIPLASGLIAGEALVAVIVPLLVIAGILKIG